MRVLLINILILIPTLSFSQKLKYDYWNFSNLNALNITSISCFEYNHQDSSLLYSLSVDTVNKIITGKYFQEDISVHGISGYWNFEKIYNEKDSLISFITQRDEVIKKIKYKRKHIKLNSTKIKNKQFVYRQNILLNDTYTISENSTIISENDTTLSENVIYKCVRDYQYDNKDQLVKVYSNLDCVKYLDCSFHYDTINRLIKSIDYRKGKIHEIKHISYNSNGQRVLEVDTTNLDLNNPLGIRKILYNYPNDTTIERTLVYFSLKHHPDTTFKRTLNNKLRLETFSSLRKSYQNIYKYADNKEAKWIFVNINKNSITRNYEYNKDGLLVQEKLDSKVENVRNSRIKYFYTFEY